MQSAPENLEVVVRGVEEFIARQMRESRRVVLVTVSRPSSVVARVRIWSSLFTLRTLIHRYENRMLTCTPSSPEFLLTGLVSRVAVQRSPWSSTCETKLSQPCISMREER